jgi:shikimate kinase
MSNVEDIAQRIMDDKINTRPLLTDRKEEIVLFLESRMEHYLSFEKILTLDREEPIEKTIANLMRILRLEAKIHKIPR